MNDFAAYLLRAHIEYTTAGIAPERKRHGYRWTAVLALVAIGLVGAAFR